MCKNIYLSIIQYVLNLKLQFSVSENGSKLQFSVSENENKLRFSVSEISIL